MCLVKRRGRDSKIIPRLKEGAIAENSDGGDKDDKDNHPKTKADKVVPSASHHRRIERSHRSHTLQHREGKVGQSRDHDIDPYAA